MKTKREVIIEQSTSQKMASIIMKYHKKSLMDMWPEDGEEVYEVNLKQATDKNLSDLITGLFNLSETPQGLKFWLDYATLLMKAEELENQL